MSLSFPDSWDVKIKNGRLYGSPKGDDSFFTELSELDSPATDEDAAIKEAKSSIEESFKNLKYDEPERADNGGLSLIVINAKGEDQDGTANINAVLVLHPKSKKVFQLLIISSQAAFEKYGNAGVSIIKSLKAVE